MKCKICEAPTKWGYEKKAYRKYCSSKCSNSDPDVKEKTKQTNLKNLGVENPFQSETVRNKAKNTNLKTYGTEHPMQSPEVKEKTKQTNLNIRGVEYSSQSPEVKEKTKQTNLKNLGVENPFQSEMVKEKIKQINVNRLGVEYPTQSAVIRSKVKKKFIEKYGGHPKNIHIIDSINHLNDRQWLEEHYIHQEKSASQIAVELDTTDVTVGNYLRKHGIKTRSENLAWSLKCSFWLHKIMKEQNIFIQVEYKIPGTRFRVDGYCEKTNTIYEFYGDLWHGNPQIYNSHDKCHPYNRNISAGQLYQTTMLREKSIKKLGYALITIWESEFNKIAVNVSSG